MTPVWGWETIYEEEHHDLFDKDSKLFEIGAGVMGRDINQIISENRTLKEMVLYSLSLEDRVQKKEEEQFRETFINLQYVHF